MASPAAVLSILVEANTSAANANLAKTNAELDATKASAMGTTSATSKTGSALKKMGTMAKWGGAALAAGFVVAAKKSIETTNDLTKGTLSLQKNLGLSGKAASEWAGVARARGADASKLGMAFKTLASQISAAGHGSEASKQMFEELGFSQKDIQKAMTDTQFAVGKVADGLNALPAGADKAAFSGKLFGRGWQTIAPVLRDGSDAMQEQLDTVEKYGGVIAGKTLKQQEDFLAAQRESKIAWQGMQVQLGTALTPALMDVNKQFQKVARIMADKRLTDDEKFQKVADIIQKDMSKALDVIVKMIPTIASRVGEQAPKIAQGLVEGFLNANAWGKLLIGGWLISKMGGWGAVSSLGTQFGTRFGTSAATAESAALAKGGAGGVVAGGAVAGKASKFTRVAGTVGPIVAIPGVFALLKRLKETQDTVTDSSSSLGDKVKSVYTTAFPIIGDEVNLANKAMDAFGGGTVHATGKVIDLNNSVNDLAMNFNDGGKAARTLRRNFGDLSTKSAQDAIDGLRDKYGNLVNAGHNMSAAQRHDWIDVAEAAHGKGELTQKQLENLTGAFTHNSQKWRDSMKDAAKVTGQTTQSIAESVGKAGVHVSRTYSGMVEVVGGGLNWLTTNTSKAAQALGVKESIKFHATPAATHGAGGAGNRVGLNRGGDVPGVGNTDTVPAMLTPGEFVIRKEQAAKHRGLLEAINFRKYAKGGSVIEQALGPYTIPPIMYDPNHAGSNSHVHADFFTVAQALAYGHKAQGMGWSIGEYTPKQGNPFGFGPITTQHQSPGHYDGTAWDANQGVVESRAAVAALAKLFNSGVAGAAVEKIKRLILHGPTGSMRLRETGQAALDKVWHAANKYLAKQSPTMTTTGKDFPGGQFSKGQLASLWSSTGRGGDSNLMAAIGMAESGGNPGAVSSAGARGLWQIMPFWGGGDKLFDPTYNAKKAHTVLAQQGLGAWSAYTNGAYQQYLRKGGMVMPPFGGSFGDGGVVPGPIGSPRTIVAHGGENVGGRPIVNVIFRGDTGWLRDFVDIQIEEAHGEQSSHDRQLSRMR